MTEEMKMLQEEHEKTIELVDDDEYSDVHDECRNTEDYIPSSSTKSRTSNNSTGVFPQIPVRMGFETINPIIIMKILVILESVWKVDGRKAPGLLAYVANKLFQQHWIVTEEKQLVDDEDEIMDEDDSIEEINDNSEEPVKKKPRQFLCEYDYVIPSRKTISHMVKSFAILSFTDMAEHIENAQKNDAVVAFGTDDTVKAAGNKKFYIKTGHITIIGNNRKRESFSTEFHENPSHSGKEAA